MELKTAAAYIRVSTDDQIEFSPDSQIKAIKDYAIRKGMILLNEFIFKDEGISGKNTKKRPEFNRMIGIAKTKPKPFDCILVWKFSRFARNREDSVVYKAMLRKQQGIDVISISESIGDDKMSILIEALIEAMDEYYSINLAEEVKRGMTEKAKRGQPQTAPPFGYEMRDKQFYVHEKEGPIVKMIFEDFIEGAGYIEIAKKINTMGIRTHRGNLFENRTVEYILRNPVYIGKLRWNPKERTRRDYSHPDLLTVDSSHEPIIDGTTWNRAEERVGEIKALYKKYYKPQYKTSHWLAGMLTCGACGATLSNMGQGFQCNNYVRGRCVSHSIAIKKIEGIVLDKIKNDIEANSANVEVLDDLKSHKNKETLQKQLSSAEQKLLRVKGAFEAGIDTIIEYKENKNRIVKEITDINDKIKQENKPRKIDMKPLIKKMQTAYKIISSDSVPNEEKAKAIKSVVKRIIFDKSTNEFVFTYYIS